MELADYSTAIARTSDAGTAEPSPRFACRHLIRLVFVIARTGLGCLLIWSSIHKILLPYDFLAGVYDYELVGPHLGLFVAACLPWVEAAVGVCLVCNLFAGGAFLGACGLLLTFVFAQASVIWRGFTTGCACFGGAVAEPIGYSSLVRTLLLFVLACLGLAFVLIDPPRTATVDGT